MSDFNGGRGIVVDKGYPGVGFRRSKIRGSTAEGNHGNGIDVLCQTVLSGNNTGQSFPNGGEALSLHVDEILVANGDGLEATMTDPPCFGDLTGAVTHHSSDGIKD